MGRMTRTTISMVIAVALILFVWACVNPMLEEISRRVSDYNSTPPVAEFSESRTTGCVPLQVSFSDGSVDGGPVRSWLWDFGDGATSTQKNPAHRYTKQGSYTVSLTVSGPGGSDTISKTDHIRAAHLDVNGDGYSDYIIGEPNYGSHYNGRAFVHSGANGAIIYTRDAESEEDRFGYVVADGGDINADGYGDFIIGAYTYKNDAATGRAYVYSGINGSILYQKTGEGAFQYFSGSIAGGGDIDGDGYSDFVIGAPTYPNNTTGDRGGKIYVYSGYNGSEMYSAAGWYDPIAISGDRLGASIGIIGDINGDGRDEFIVGAPDAPSSNTDGQAYIYSHNGSLISKIQTINPPATYGTDCFNFGAAVAGCGDVNNDGIPDFIIGDPEWGTGSGYGRIFVYSGANYALLYYETGNYGGDNLGTSVGGADFNQDGYSDYFAGNSDYQGGTYKGLVFVYNGQTGGTMYTKYGVSNGDRFGTTVSAGGDANADGYPDFIVGAYGFSSFNGKAYVFSGQNGAELTSLSKTGSTADYLGRGVSIGH